MEEVVSIHLGPVEIPERPSRTPKPPPELGRSRSIRHPPVDPIAVTPNENPQLPVDSRSVANQTSLIDRGVEVTVFPWPQCSPVDRDADARPPKKHHYPALNPRRQAMAGIEGWVRLSVVVDANGLVAFSPGTGIQSTAGYSMMPPFKRSSAGPGSHDWLPGGRVEQTVIQTIDFKT